MKKTWDDMTQAERDALLTDPPPNPDIKYVGGTFEVEEYAKTNRLRQYQDTIRDDTRRNMAISVMFKRLDRQAQATVVAVLIGVLGKRDIVARKLSIDQSTAWRLINFFKETADGIQKDCQAEVKEVQVLS